MDGVLSVCYTYMPKYEESHRLCDRCQTKREVEEDPTDVNSDSWVLSGSWGGKLNDKAVVESSHQQVLWLCKHSKEDKAKPVGHKGPDSRFQEEGIKPFCDSLFTVPDI
jgi:hypothetical protein